MVLNLKMFCGSTRKSKKKVDLGSQSKRIDWISKGK